MARRYKPLPAGQVVWLQVWGRTAEVISDDGAGLVYLLERMRRYDYSTHVRRSSVRPATAAELEAHQLELANIAAARQLSADQVGQWMTRGRQLHARAPAPADPAG